jgi:hypothetical protein
MELRLKPLKAHQSPSIPKDEAAKVTYLHYKGKCFFSF